MCIKKILLLIIVSNVWQSINAQLKNINFIYPLDREPLVTGNYGEIRPNHFHAGLDFSTDPTINLPIKSVANGYVSRIKISSGGYGKVLYITHANGYVSVYAHQKRYADKIDMYVKKKQTEQQKNEIELILTPTELLVEQGETIGYTGNSGSSTGPHLHYEVREEKSEVPINPLLIYDVKDNIKPMITSIGFYNATDTLNIVLEKIEPVKNVKGELHTTKSHFILNSNVFALAFSGYDQANGSTNQNNIYEASIKLDGNLVYHHQLNNISFDNAKYVNVFSEKINGQKMQKCFTPSCRDVGIYQLITNGGKIILPDTLKHTIELHVKDEKGNQNMISFTVKAKLTNGYAKNTNALNAFCNKETVIKKENFEVVIPVGSITNACYVATYINKIGKIVVGNPKDMLLKPYSFLIKILNPIKGLENKLIAINEGHYITGKYENGWFKSESKSFGTFDMVYDTTKPVITYPIGKTDKKNTTNRIVFKIQDTQSGIADYHVFVNDVWKIAEYDAKSATVTCTFTEALKPNDIVTIEVIDRVGNKAVWKK